VAERNVVVKTGRLGLDRIIAIYDIRNEASGRVMRKLGMRPYLRTRDPNHEVDLEVYELRREGRARDG